MGMTGRSLNPTLDWICALTFRYAHFEVDMEFGLNPTLDWICALTLLGL